MESSAEPAAGQVLYSDHLVEITPGAITFRRFYFPLPGDRTVPFGEIDRIDAKIPTVLSGKWRYSGTGSPWIWFPPDWKRPSRDRIFHAFLKNGKKIGFTAGDSEAVIAVLKREGVFGTDEAAGNESAG